MLLRRGELSRSFPWIFNVWTEPLAFLALRHLELAVVMPPGRLCLSRPPCLRDSCFLSAWQCVGRFAQPGSEEASITSPRASSHCSGTMDYWCCPLGMKHLLSRNGLARCVRHPSNRHSLSSFSHTLTWPLQQLAVLTQMLGFEVTRCLVLSKTWCFCFSFSWLLLCDSLGEKG